MRWLRLSALVALAFLTLPRAAFSQSSVQDRGSFNRNLQGLGISGMYGPDSTARLFRVDSDGNLKIVEQYPVSSLYDLRPSVISGIFTCRGDETKTTPGLWEIRDSTTVIDCRGYNRAALLMFPSPTLTTDTYGSGSVDSLSGAVFALQTRAHYSMTADSQSTFRLVPKVLMQAAGGASSGTAATRDSVGSLSDIIANDVTVNTTTQAINDSLWKRVLPDEVAIVVSNVNNANRGMVIWNARLNDPSGVGVLPFMSWRLRCVASYTKAGAGGVVKLPQASGAAAAGVGLGIRVRCDLVLWRE